MRRWLAIVVFITLSMLVSGAGGSSPPRPHVPPLVIGQAEHLSHLATSMPYWEWGLESVSRYEWTPEVQPRRMLIPSAHLANRQRNIERATLAYDAMQQYLYLENAAGLYLETYPHTGPNAYSYIWPLGQVLGGTIDMCGLPGIGGQFRIDAVRRLATTNLYWDDTLSPPAYASYVPAPWGHAGDIYYDDNVWIGLELVRWYRMTGDVTALDRAREIFALMVSGWSDDDYPAPGGIYWVDAPHSQARNTISTGPAAQLGLHLYELSVDPVQKLFYFSWSSRMYNWVYDHMLADNDMFWDSIEPDGTIDERHFSYNQGVMIGANALMYRVTGESRYLERAERIVQASLPHFEGGWFARQPIALNAIYFKNLLTLYAYAQDPEYLGAMQRYTDYMWEHHSDPETHLMTMSAPVALLEQASIVELYATLAWDPNDYWKLA
jgi:hypothetical protein